MLIKIGGMGLKNYLKDKMNIFDCIIVVFSFFDLVLSNATHSNSMT